MITIFKPTPKMPTYLLAFVISDFANKSETININSRSLKFTSFSRPNQAGNLDFGIKTAQTALKLFEDHFNVTYDSFSKLDQVALPVFNFGGMENYGIVFYREDFLLYEEGVTSTYDKEYIAATVVHEVRLNRGFNSRLIKYRKKLRNLLKNFYKIPRY